jgi:hypothetical protein
MDFCSHMRHFDLEPTTVSTSAEKTMGVFLLRIATTPKRHLSLMYVASLVHIPRLRPTTSHCTCSLDAFGSLNLASIGPSIFCPFDYLSSSVLL